MSTFVTPGVSFEVVDHAVRGITALRTDVAAFVGLAARGPVDAAVPVESWEQFTSTFGSVLSFGYLATAVKAFFENGGRRCHIVRVAAPSVRTDSVPEPPSPVPDRTATTVVDGIAAFVPGAAATLRQQHEATLTIAAVDAVERRLSWTAPVPARFALDRPITIAGGNHATVTDPDMDQPPDGLSSLVRSVAGFTTGMVVDLHQHVEQTLQVDRVDAAARRVTWRGSLDPSLDPRRTLRLATGAGHARATLPDAAGRPAVCVRAASPGAWGDALSVQVTRTNAAATATAAVAQPPDGSALTVASVSGFEPAALVRLVQPRAGGGLEVRHRIVATVDHVRARLVWTEPLDASFDPTVPATIETLAFTVTVREDGRVRTSAAGLSLLEDHPRHVERVADELRLVTLAPPADAPPATDPDMLAARLPANAPPQPLGGGRDGLAALVIDDLVGDALDPRRRGLRVLETVDEVAIVAMPDVHARAVPPRDVAPLPPPEPDPCLPPPPSVPTPTPFPIVREVPPGFTTDDISAAQQRLVEHCETARDRVAVLDPPSGFDPGEVASWRQRFDSSWGALYYPWVAVLDLTERGAAPVRMVPPSGHVVGVYAHADLTVGVHRAPANLGLRWIQDVATTIDDATQGVLNPAGVNCLRVAPARGLQVYGARTLSSDPSFRYVNVRRLLAMIGEAILVSVQWSVFEPHDERLRQLLRLSIGGFLRALWRAGALAGTRAEEAYAVTCDGSNNPPETVAAGQLWCDVAVAPAIPAEFVIVRIGRTENEWRVEA